MNPCRRAIVALFCSSVGACTMLPREVAPDNASTILRLYERMLHEPPATVAAAIASARAALAAQPSLAHRLEVAMLLTLPGAPVEQLHAAQELLTNCAETPTEEKLTALCELTGTLVRGTVDAQQKVLALEENAKASERHAQDLQLQLTQLYAQSQAKLESDAHKRITGLEHQLSEQRNQLEAMRQQLQELQAIERSIETRREVAPESARTP